MTAEKKISLCIASQQAYGAMAGGRGGFIGGIEWQTTLMAKWFAKHGHEVSILTWNEGGPDEEMIDGVRVVKLCRKDQGLKGLRFFHPKWTSLVRALGKVDADLYYQNGSECTTGQVAMWCRSHRKPFVFSAASDADCDPAMPELHPQEKPLYRLGLRQASEVVVQTMTQQQRLRDSFSRESVVIPMPCPERPAKGAAKREGQPRVLWIGRVCQVKRPDRLLDLAAKCPKVPFDLVGPFSEKSMETEIRDRAAKLGNVQIHGGIPRDRTHDYYRASALLCSTSDYEGFPNTFLEAFSHGLPVVSTFDPDGVIMRKNLGRAAASVEELAGAIHGLLGAPAEYKKSSENARQYFLENHEVESVLPRFERLFQEMVAKTEKNSQ